MMQRMFQNKAPKIICWFKRGCNRRLEIKPNAVKTYGRVAEQTHVRVFLTSTLDRDEWSVSRPSRFTPRENAVCTHSIGGRVGPRTVLDDVEKRKFLPSQGLEFLSLGRQSIYQC
jgi:hypothetical protein